MNWTRERLKTNGKIAFKKNYWACVAVAVIMGIITGLSSISGGRTGSGASQNSLYGNDGFSFSYHYGWGFPFAGLAIAMAAIILMIVIWALKIFVGNLLEVGGKRFFVLNKTENPTVGTMFDAFRSGHYVNIVLTMFLKELFTSLWTLLLVIPGIVKHYDGWTEDGDVYSGSVIPWMGYSYGYHMWNGGDFLRFSIQAGNFCRVICI